MEQITIKDILEVSFDILEENNAIIYSRKYNREYLIEGLSQEEVSAEKWFGFSTKSGLGNQLSRMIINKMDKLQQQSWLFHLINITGYKKCSICNNIYERIEEYFSNRKVSNDGFMSFCKNCDNNRNKKYAKENPDKIKETRKNTYEKKKKEDPPYFKRKNALARRRLKQRTPKWITEEEKKNIQDFYADCPKGYQVDHIDPLYSKLVCGLHVLSNLQYLSEFDNKSKHNNFEIYSI